MSKPQMFVLKKGGHDNLISISMPVWRAQLICPACLDRGFICWFMDAFHTFGDIMPIRLTANKDTWNNYSIQAAPNP